MNETLILPPMSAPIPPSWEEARKGGGSAAGYHAVSEWMTCPERSRLSKLGVRPSTGEYVEEGSLSDLDFGILIHTLRGIRVVHGMQVMVEVLSGWRAAIGDTSYMRAALLMAVYDQTFPRETDPLEYLGIEVEVRTNVAKPGAKPLIRTVRYDTLVYAQNASGVKELYSFECKTSSRSGPGVLLPYYPQGMVQMALWNANAALVEQYGIMRGVIFDLMVKTKNPSCDRIPRAFNTHQQELARAYMRLPENGGAQFTVQPDGSYPRMLHACWGRWRPCEFINLCHEQAFGSYEIDGVMVTPEMVLASP